MDKTSSPISPARSLWISLLVLVGTIFGCTATRGIEAYPDHPDPVLSSGYSLLYDLVSKEARVDGILVLKSTSAPTAKLIKQIAATSAQAKEKIQKIADQDSSIRLDLPALPQIEQATHDAIESATTKTLLFAGDEFELALLLTQHQATDYGAALTGEIRAVDPDDHRQTLLNNLSEKYRDLNQQVFLRMRSIPSSPPE